MATSARADARLVPEHPFPDILGRPVIARVVNELDALLAERGVVFQDPIGCAADALAGYAEQRAIPGRWRDFVPDETLAETETP